MELSKYSRNNILRTFERWDVPKDYADPMYNYLVHGFSPGSFFTAMLANDAMGAIQSSHPGNTIPALKNLMGWMRECCPYVARGSYENVRAWLEFTVEKRQDILEQHGLVFNKDQELILMLKNESTVEPILW